MSDLAELHASQAEIAAQSRRASRFNGWLRIGLAAVSVAMLCFFLFEFRYFYGLWCRFSGTQLNPNNLEAPSAAPAGGGRSIDVLFEGVAYDELPVRFYPDQPEMKVQVDTDATNVYHFKNLSDQTVYFRPVHQVSPIAASLHFGMKVCFCFNNQAIAPGETKDFTVVFTFGSQLDERIGTVTVRYGLFKIKPGEAQTAEQKRQQEQLMGGGIVTPGAGVFPDAGAVK